MSIEEKLLDGKYHFFKDGAQYSEEDFSILKEDKPQGNYIFKSEILSRVQTGEFLKIQTRYELTHQFDPISVLIKRSLGKRRSKERFTIDPNDKHVHYSFDGMNGFFEHDRAMGSRFHVATPAFVTSALMTQIKKLDSVQRTPYQIVTSPNVWDYVGEIQESEIIVELKSLDPVMIKINDNELKTTHCTMTESVDETKVQNTVSNFYLSKYFHIPYKAEFENGIEIRVEKLKSHESNYKNMFR